MITSSSGTSPDFTVHFASGVLSGPQLRDAVVAFLLKAPTAMSLWDFTTADLSKLSTQDLVSVFDAARPYALGTDGGKTATLFDSTVGFGLGRLCEALAEMRDFPCEVKAFLSREDALGWLRMPSDGSNGAEGVA